MYVRRRTRSPWRVLGVFLLTLAVIVIWAVTLENGKPRTAADCDVTAAAQVEPTDVLAYFPAQLGLTQHFTGEGSEYAAFTRRITAVDETLMLVEEETSATTVGAVYSRAPGRVALLAREEEFVAEDSQLMAEVDLNGTGERVVLQSPLTVGNRWEDEGSVYEVTAIHPEMRVPAGTFYDVMEVKVSPQTTSPGHELREFYAVNMGLIRRDFISFEGETSYTVSSYLHSFELNPVHQGETIGELQQD